MSGLGGLSIALSKARWGVLLHVVSSVNFIENSFLAVGYINSLMIVTMLQCFGGHAGLGLGSILVDSVVEVMHLGVDGERLVGGRQGGRGALHDLLR